jgi:hypothetical protein
MTPTSHTLSPSSDRSYTVLSSDTSPIGCYSPPKEASYETNETDETSKSYTLNHAIDRKPSYRPIHPLLDVTVRRSRLRRFRRVRRCRGCRRCRRCRQFHQSRREMFDETRIHEIRRHSPSLRLFLFKQRKPSRPRQHPLA